MCKVKVMVALRSCKRRDMRCDSEVLIETYYLFDAHEARIVWDTTTLFPLGGLVVPRPDSHQVYLDAIVCYLYV